MSAESTPLVVVLAGSPADSEHCNRIADAVRSFAIDVQLRVASAHRTPEHALDILRAYEAAYADGRPTVLITVAGRSNALSGFADPQVTMPVIACPPPGDANDVWSSIRMPSGVAPVFAFEPMNAAIAAAKMLGLADAGARARVATAQRNAQQRVLDADAALMAQSGATQ